MTTVFKPAAGGGSRGGVTSAACAEDGDIKIKLGGFHGNKNGAELSRRASSKGRLSRLVNHFVERILGHAFRARSFERRNQFADDVLINDRFDCDPALFRQRCNRRATQ
jgi:hypothetical protein